MANHTPGPWKHEPSGMKGRAWSIVQDNGPGEPGWSPANVTKEADSHLIAAAPDLLEALELLDKIVGNYALEQDGAIAHAKRKAAAAIAKAKGQ